MKKIISMIICIAFVFSSLGIYVAPTVANAEAAVANEEEAVANEPYDETKETVVINGVEYLVTFDSDGNVIAAEPTNPSGQQTPGISAYGKIDTVGDLIKKAQKTLDDRRKAEDKEKLKDLKEDYKDDKKTINGEYYYPASKVGSKLKKMEYYDHFAAYLVKNGKSTDDVYIRLDKPISTDTAADRLVDYKDVWSVSENKAENVAKEKTADGKDPKGPDIHNKDKNGKIKPGHYYRHYHYVDKEGNQQGGHSFYYDMN